MLQQFLAQWFQRSFLICNNVGIHNCFGVEAQIFIYHELCLSVDDEADYQHKNGYTELDGNQGFLQAYAIRFFRDEFLFQSCNRIIGGNNISRVQSG